MTQNLTITEVKPFEKIFVFEGEISIQNIESIRNSLFNGIIDTKSLTINLNNISSFDIAFLQLLYSTIKYCEEQEINILIEAKDIKDEYVKAIEKSGFCNMIN